MTTTNQRDPNNYYLPTDYDVSSVVRLPRVHPGEAVAQRLIWQGYGANTLEEEAEIYRTKVNHPSRAVREELLAGDRRKHDIRIRYHELTAWSKALPVGDTVEKGLMSMAVRQNLPPVDIWFGDWWTPDGTPAPPIPERYRLELGPKTDEHVRHKEAELARYILGDHHEVSYRLAQVADALTNMQQTRLNVLKTRAPHIIADSTLTHPYDLHDLSLWGYGAEMGPFTFKTATTWRGTGTAIDATYAETTSSGGHVNRIYTVAAPPTGATRLQATYARAKPERFSSVFDTIVGATTVSTGGERREFSDTQTGFDVPLANLSHVEVRSVSHMREELVYTVRVAF